MDTRKTIAAVAVGAVMLTAGTMAGIATGNAAGPDGPPEPPRLMHGGGPGSPGGPGGGRGGRGGPGLGHGAVHAEAVVPNAEGDGFVTVTSDRGTLKTVSGRTLTIVEGTEDATYDTVEVAIPAKATVRRNFKASKLSALQAGDHVFVTSSEDGTFVMAVDPDTEAARPKPPTWPKA